MKKFNLKQAILENKATFFSSLNEDSSINKVKKQLDALGVKYEMSGNKFKPFKVIYKPINKSDEFYDKFEDIVDLFNLKGVVKQSMKESKLRSKIREMILAEMALDIDNMEDAPESEVDFLSELESMLDEETPYINPEADEIDDEDLEAASDYFDLLREKKDEEEAPEEAPAPEEEEVDTTVDVETDEVNPAVKAVQDALTQAQAAAQKLGDEKLLNQIGNTITFFTREHVVEKPGKGELQESFIRKMQLRAGIIK